MSAAAVLGLLVVIALGSYLIERLFGKRKS
jgi:hypothetical protein